MALVPAVALGVATGAISYQVSKGVPKAEPIQGSIKEQQYRDPYWRNWTGAGFDDAREDAYMPGDPYELQVGFPRELDNGDILPPDNDSGVNPAVGAINRHPGRPWQRFHNQQQRVPIGPRNRPPPKSNRAPLPPKQKSMPTK